MKLAKLLVLSTALASLAACEETTTSAPLDGGNATGPTTSDADGGVSPTSRPDLDAMARGGDCGPAPSAVVEHRGEITADETWSAGSLHRVTSNLRVLATLTLEACTRVEVGGGYVVSVGSSSGAGKLVAKGSNAGALRPVLVTSTDATKPWLGLEVDATGSADLAYTVLAGAGPGSASNVGMLRVFGASRSSDPALPTVTKSVRAEWLLLEGAKTSGVYLQRYAGFTDDSPALAVRSSEAEAIRVELGAAGAMPKELVFARNTRDAILVEQSWSGTIPTTFVKRGVPYDVDGPLYVQSLRDGDVATWTVEAGVTVRFAEGRGASGVFVGASEALRGQVVARGTAAEPIRFTSSKAAPAAGDWMGFYFKAYPTSGTRFEHVTVEYAGANNSTIGSGCGPSDNDASMFFGGKRPTEGWVRASKFRNGAGQTGIVLGWTSDEDGPDFVADNTFENMPSCRVSRWKKATGPACPGTSADVTCL